LSFPSWQHHFKNLIILKNSQKPPDMTERRKYTLFIIISINYVRHTCWQTIVGGSIGGPLSILQPDTVGCVASTEIGASGFEKRIRRVFLSRAVGSPALSDPKQGLKCLGAERRRRRRWSKSCATALRVTSGSSSRPWACLKMKFTR